MDRSQEIFEKVKAMKEVIDEMKTIIAETIVLRNTNPDIMEIFKRHEIRLRKIFIFDKNDNILN